ncbi:MAG: polysulfide reductase NrfD, partial [candidate division NC10 bacterium]|nr:polysulfide reductase NrfD [candidate division NC10 bacterium]
MTESRLKQLFWISGAVFFTVGLGGWYDRFAHGLLNVNLGSIVPWGLWEAGYIYFIGLSAGSFLISSLVYVFNVKRFERIGRLAVFTAVVTLLLALLLVWAGLGHMFRFWHVLGYANFKSPMAVIIWLYSTYFLLLVVELWFLLRRDLVVGASLPGLKGAFYRLLSLGSRDRSDRSAVRDRRVVRVLAVIGVPLAIMFHGGVGALFGVLAARPHWHTGMFPILFLLSALVSGGALLTVIAAIFQDGWRQNRETVISLGQMVMSLLLLDLIFLISEMLVSFYGGVPGHLAAQKLIISGPFWWVFWWWQMVLGTLIPVLLLVFPTRKDPRWVSLAGLLIAAGFLGVRLNIVIPGLAAEEIAGLSKVIASPRMTTYYVPSATE